MAGAVRDSSNAVRAGQPAAEHRAGDAGHWQDTRAVSTDYQLAQTKTRVPSASF